MQEETLNKILSIVENVLNRITILEQKVDKNEEKTNKIISGKIDGVRKEMHDLFSKNEEKIDGVRKEMHDLFSRNEEKIEGVRKEMKEISNKNVKETAEEISSLAESISRKSHQSNKKIRKEMQSLIISNNEKELNKEIHI